MIAAAPIGRPGTNADRAAKRGAVFFRAEPPAHFAERRNKFRDHGNRLNLGAASHGGGQMACQRGQQRIAQEGTTRHQSGEQRIAVIAP